MRSSRCHGVQGRITSRERYGVFVLFLRHSIFEGPRRSSVGGNRALSSRSGTIQMDRILRYNWALCIFLSDMRMVIFIWKVIRFHFSRYNETGATERSASSRAASVKQGLTMHNWALMIFNCQLPFFWPWIFYDVYLNELKERNHSTCRRLLSDQLFW